MTSTSVTRLRALAAAALLGLVALPAQAQRTFSSLTMFGDSFSDVGNANALTFGVVPQRLSNGIVWSDALHGALGLGPARASFPLLPTQPAPATGVYAVSGALSVGAAFGIIPSTATQIGRWCQFAAGSCGRTADANGLYTLFVGGNDIRSIAGNNALSVEQRRAATVQVANNVIAQAGQLRSTGVNNLLLMYMPDLGRTPDRVFTAQSAELTALTTLFNQTLEGGIGGLRAANPTMNLFDLRLDNLFFNLLAQPEAYGFDNVTGNCSADRALPACTGYVFFDNLHPSAAAHALIGAAAYDLVAFDRNVQMVPEPATIALMAGGLVMLGGVAARRRTRAA